MDVMENVKGRVVALRASLCRDEQWDKLREKWEKLESLISTALGADHIETKIKQEIRLLLLTLWDEAAAFCSEQFNNLQFLLQRRRIIEY